ncbi:SUMF1/EgtB/PvdO family nonheme iron enzyme [Bradyrhizobium liaoningense]|uniref:SUMF1/EgtB/PvdO family nonheme iron enzyme n=1 Tax=Bradyrhizobium liaoningense TaxID=43992 RepID=UPI001BA95F6A|nr:SUMF1/EgtB/PvdO family nonheme iron enzyme [Bradyrhizobium liaoningense]MBR0948578.1 SUMF1/EgtB/PvdO family nonheme iron enzyme [Bradyrhizobium liaoningense]
MRLAVVIAANGPEDSSDRLRFAEKDGDRIERALKGRRPNYQTVRIPPDTKAADVRGQIFDHAESCAPSDTFLVYFSGHGRSVGGNLLLQLNGSTSDKPFGTHLIAADVMAALRACPARNRILILDCCNAGGMLRQTGMKSGGTDVQSLGITSDSFDIVMASGFLEAAFEIESLGGGFLTTAIVEALDDRFDQADADHDRAISFQDLTIWLEKRHEDVNRNRDALRQVPKPVRLGYSKGISYLTRLPSETLIHEFILPNDTRAVLLPTFPQTYVLAEKVQSEFVFAMGIHPVTNAQYRAFCEATNSPKPEGEQLAADRKRWIGPLKPWDWPAFSQDDAPVTCVSVRDALKYCFWIKEQCDPRLVHAILLPSEKLWNFAAFRRPHWAYSSSNLQPAMHHRSLHPASVRAPERTSSLGLTDLFGNVWEWGGTEDEWARVFLSSEAYERRFEAEEPREDPFRFSIRQPRTREHIDRYRYLRQIRGGSFLDDLDNIDGHIRTTDLSDGDSTKHSDLGFRILAAIRVDAMDQEALKKLKDYYPLFGRDVDVW